MKIKLTKVVRSTTNKEGNALVTRDGRPYTRLAIKTSEHGDKWLSGFNNAQSNSWAEGQEVEIDVEQKGEYLNFKIPKPAEQSNEKLEQILNYLVGIKMALASIDAKLMGKERVMDEGNYPPMDEEPSF